MISRFSPTFVAAFEFVFRPWMRRRVHAIRVAGLPTHLPSDRPILFVSNHVSWWDAFILREVQRMIRPDAPVFVVMSEERLSRLPFFRLMGVVGIEQSSPSSILAALRSLRTRVRERPDAVVILFPQGRIWPAHRRPLGFARGLELIADGLSPVILPVAIHAEPLNTVSPTFFVSIAPPMPETATRPAIERAVEAELDAVHDLLTTHGEDAAKAWPEPHGRLSERAPAFVPL